MKILFLCHKMPFPFNDGGTIATFNMINGFANYGDEVTVLAMQTPKHSFNVNELPIEIKENIHWNQVKVNTNLNPFAALYNLVFTNKPYNSVRFESKSYNEALNQLLRTQSFDIVQLEGLYLKNYIHTIRSNSKALISFRAHNIEHEIWQRLAQNETLFLKRKYLQVLANRVKEMEVDILKIVDLVVPITQRDAAVLNFGDDSKVFVSSTGMQEEKFKLTQPKNYKSLFYIGALDWLPNQESIYWFLKNCWTELKLQFPDWEFVIAGRNAPKSFINELKKYDAKFLGEVENSTDFIDAYNVMLVPLLSGSGMRIKIIEGMARGKCILTTTIGAEGIPAQPGSDIYIQDSAFEFTNVLKNLMQNQQEIEKCGENAFNFVRANYNNKTIIGELKKFYSKHLDRA